MDGDKAPAGHIEGTCGRDAPGKDEKGREPDSKVRARSGAERLVSTTRRAVRQLPLSWLAPGPALPRAGPFRKLGQQAENDPRPSLALTKTRA